MSNAEKQKRYPRPLVRAVVSESGRQLLGGLLPTTPHADRFFEVEAIELANAEHNPELLRHSHVLVFALGQDDEDGGRARTLASVVTSEYSGLRLPVIRLGGQALLQPSDAAYMEMRYERLPAAYEDAIDLIVRELSVHSHPRLVLIDDTATELANIDLVPVGSVGERQYWLFPITYRVLFDQRHERHQVAFRRHLRKLCATPQGTTEPTRVFLDILLDTNEEGRAVAAEVLLSDRRSTIHPISGFQDQAVFTEGKALLARAFPGRIFHPTHKKEAKDAWGRFLESALRQAHASPVLPEFTNKLEIRPIHFQEALQAACLTLLGPRLPFVLYGAREDCLYFTEQQTARPSAALLDVLIPDEVIPEKVPEHFLGSLHPDYLRGALVFKHDQRARSMDLPLEFGGALAGLLPPGQLCSLPDGSSEPLRELLRYSVVGLGTSWRPQGAYARALCDHLMQCYQRERRFQANPQLSPLQSLLDVLHPKDPKQQGDKQWLKRRWRNQTGGLPEGFEELARRIARSLHGTTPNRWHEMAVGLLLWGTLDLLRFTLSAGKKDEPKKGAVFKALVDWMPVDAISPWAQRGLGRRVKASSIMEADLDGLVVALQSVPVDQRWSWTTVGAAPWEILSQLTLHLLMS